MIFYKKNFQCVMAPIPLFQTPQKIGLLRQNIYFSVCLYDMVTNDELNGINFNCALIKKGLAIAQEDEGYLQEPYELLTDEFFPTTSSCMDSFQVNISNDDELEAHNKVVKKDFERPSDVCI